MESSFPIGSEIISSEIYLISPIQLRNLEIEKHARNRDNAYDELPVFAHLTREQKEAKYDTLKDKIRQEGFRWKYPIIIKLRRKNNKHDQIFQGHHRLNIAIELGLATVPVRFMEWEKEYNAKGNWVEK